jgi:uncharacterized membrane protein YqjE
MLKTIIRLSSERPDLVQEYLTSYVELLRELWHQSKRHNLRRVCYALLACISTTAFMVVAAVAFMLTLILPDSKWQELMIAPAILLFMSFIFALLATQQRSKTKALQSLSYELQQDKRMLEKVQGLS